MNLKPTKSNPPKKAKKAKAAPKKRRGKHLLNQVIRLTGIPSQAIHRELNLILERKGIDPKDLTIEQLRTVVASYLREIMGGILEGHSFRRPEKPH